MVVGLHPLGKMQTPQYKSMLEFHHHQLLLYHLLVEYLLILLQVIYTSKLMEER